jgi:hypothetical protein
LRYILTIMILASTIYANVGKIVALHGKIEIVRFSYVTSAQVGTSIEEYDTIVTSKNSKAQILFSDKTAITIGANSKFSIDKYLYKTSNPQARFSFVKGIFQTITGEIGKISPDSFKLRTKNAHIGIRGTEIYMDISTQGSYIACTTGEIYVTSHKTFNTVNIKQGYATYVDELGSAQKPKKYRAIDIKGLDSVEDENKQKIETESTIRDTQDAKMVEEIVDNFTTPLITRYSNTPYVESTQTYQMLYPGSAVVSYDDGLGLDSSTYDPQKWSRNVIGQDAYSEYGEWQYSDSSGINHTYGLYSTGEPTPQSTLNNLQADSFSATYSGDVLARDIQNQNKGLTGEISLNIDFQNQNVTGKLDIEDGKWIADIGQRSSNIYPSTGSISADLQMNSTSATAIGGGQLYGTVVEENAQSAIGGFYFNDATNQNQMVDGVFSAKR